MASQGGIIITEVKNLNFTYKLVTILEKKLSGMTNITKILYVKNIFKSKSFYLAKDFCFHFSFCYRFATLTLDAELLVLLL